MEMLSNIGKPGYETLTKPDRRTLAQIEHLIREDGVPEPVVAEIGIGIGATSLEICRLLDNRGTLHIFDFHFKVQTLKEELEQRGFCNVVPHGNSRRTWDSYNWSLKRLLQASAQPLFDYIYLDGSHLFLHDALAFFLCDRLLKEGRYMDFDDYHWRVADSKWMAKNRHEYLTEEQINTRQVKDVVDLFVKTDPRYQEIVKNKVYRKAGPPSNQAPIGSGAP